MKLKLSTLPAALFAASLLLAGCGGSDDPPSASQDDSGDGQSASEDNKSASESDSSDSATDPSMAGTSLTFWIMGDNASPFEDLIAPFTADTGIEVKVEAIPWESVNDRLATAVASGEGPDISQVGLSLLPTYLAGEALMDVSDLVDGYPNLSDANFPSGVSRAALNPEDTVFSFPWVSDTRVLFYRSDLLAEAGYDKPPATWDELLEVSAALADRGDNKYGYYIPQWDAPLPISYVWQAGGDVIDASGNIDLQTPEFSSAVDHYLDFFANDVVPMNSDFDQALGFITGDAPMLISGPYLAGAISDQAPELDGLWDVAKVPAGKNTTSLFAGSNVGVWSGSENPEAALALINYLADPSVQVTWYETVNELPAVLGALDDLKNGTDSTVAVYADQLADSRLLPLHADWDAVGSEILTALNEIVLSGADRDETLKALYATVSEMTE